MDVVEEVIRSRTYPIVHDRAISTIRSMVSFQLEGMEMSPLEEAEMEEAICNRYTSTLTDRYTPVGIIAAQTIAENMTQSSLSSHRMAGVSKGASGFDRIKEIANLKNKSDIVKVVTTPIRGVPRSLSMINDLANSIVRITIDDIADGYEIVGDRPRWYDLFMFLMNIPPQTMSSRWIRLYLKEKSMYRYKVALPMIYSVISTNMDRGTVSILYPPSTMTDRMYIDIHAGTLPDTDDSPLYLALAEVQAQVIGGVPSVSRAEPVQVSLLKELDIVPIGDGVFELRSKAPDYIHPSAWSHMIKMMVPDVEILSPNGRRFRSSTPEYQDHKRLRHIILEIPTTYESILDKMDVDDGINLIFKKEMVDDYPFLQHVVMEDRTFSNDIDAKNFLLLDITPFTKYWYIESVCSRAEDLYSLSEVDSTRTYTTSALDAMQSLGYLAMRNMIYQAFKDNINVSHIPVGLISDNVTLYRTPVSFKRQSIANDRSEWMTSTTFEDILRYTTQNAFAGEVDHMQSVSSHILTGQMVNIGRGGDRLDRENEYISRRREHRKNK